MNELNEEASRLKKLETKGRSFRGTTLIDRHRDLSSLSVLFLTAKTRPDLLSTSGISDGFSQGSFRKQKGCSHSKWQLSGHFLYFLTGPVHRF